MRAYIIAAHNLTTKADYKQIINEEVLTGEQLPLERINSFVVKAAFPTLQEAVNESGDLLHWIEEEFEQNEYFQEDENAQISFSIDVVEISEDEFNEINSKERGGELFISARPIWAMAKP